MSNKQQTFFFFAGNRLALTNAIADVFTRANDLPTHLLTLSLYRQVHKAERRARHPVRSFAFPYKSIQEMLPVCMSRSTVLLRVDLGRPRFLLPVGIHIHACGGILFSSILRACPKYRHLLLLLLLVHLYHQLFPGRMTALAKT